ncbi:hypothetical protein DPMN_029355 [Dreissena polymorpha]|uniref:Uncharacterized protein n=1 Tax=Dreissena polymorpha TaxID=45954 RepID=A0A9D4RHA6_DREPO|nr:hypothetical protein DPMN_029355 [Dreissena polymorpha]
MKNNMCLRLVVVLLRLGLVAKCIKLELMTENIVDGQEVEIRCSGVKTFDFYFTAKSSKNQNERVKIGSCSSFHDCGLAELIHDQTYNITPMDDGGTLKILKYGHDAEGTDTCKDVLNSTQEASMQVAPKSVNNIASDFNTGTYVIFFCLLIVPIFII